MRTYKSTRPTAEKTKHRTPRRGLQAIIISAAIVIIAVALALSLTFGLRTSPVTDEPQDIPVVTAPKITFSAPLSSSTVTKQAALNRLVYNDTLKQWRTHNGVDFEAKAGSEVYTIADGTVQNVENTIVEGVVVTVAHADGYTSIYKGLENAAVQKGDRVSSGAKIGVVGNMMCEQNSGAHLHLEMKKDGKFVIATDYIDAETNK